MVAHVGERAIRVQELDAWIMDDLFERVARSGPTKLQAYRARKLAAMVDELVLAEEAARTGLSPEDLLAEVPAEAEITDEDAHAFLEQNPLAGSMFKGREDSVRRMLEKKEAEAARRAYLDDLRERIGVRVETAYQVEPAQQGEPRRPTGFPFQIPGGPPQQEEPERTTGFPFPVPGEPPERGASRF